ncbi:EspG family protein [Nocardia amikacinitolerans]|uniref:ESX secretion-associated protein EspG n=1 Tax=Nocardia amikacinitolerans TaxID=756689 RepID=UPI000832E78E|nr:ESX secretion-associated protein EspG [Nocardia amikacinitolerans]MCP2320102.1 EspG family protein [Nocardia amikacinitolerans]
MTTWTLDDFEFVVLWERLREGLLPRPFTYISRIPLERDYQRARREIRERLRTTVSAELERAIDVVARPDIRVLVRGVDGNNPGDPRGSIRMLAVRRGANGYLLTQRPGETIQHSAGFTITDCDPLRLADRVVAALPAMPGGGHDVVLPIPDEPSCYDDHVAPPRISAAWHDTHESLGRQFLQQQPARVGTIEIIQGISVFGPRGRSARRLHWRDLPADGRYVIPNRQPYSALSADRERFVRLINHEIAAVVSAIKDQRS